MKLPGAYIIDLSPLPADHRRVITAIEDIAKQVERAPQPYQVWVASNAFLESYAGNTEELMELTEALFSATKRVQPKMIVQHDAPSGVVYILGSLGFEVFLPGLKLKVVDAAGQESEIDVMKQIEAIKKAPRLRS